MRSVLSGLLIFITSSAAAAGPIDLEILSSQYRTSFDLSVDADPLRLVRTTESASPIQDSAFLASEQFSGGVTAAAAANRFAISVYGENGSPLSESSVSAFSTLEFTVLDEMASVLTLDFTGNGEASFSEGSIELVDATLGTTVWAYGWADLFQSGTVPWTLQPVDSPFRFLASIDVLTAFQADHRYALTLSMQTFGEPFETQDLTMRVSGLHAVPEPSVLIMFACGLIGMWRYRQLTLS